MNAFFRNRYFILVIICVLTGLAFPPDACAQENEAGEVDYAALESIGLYDRTISQHLGDDIWADSKRSHLASLLINMPASSEDPAIQRLIFSILLGAADADKIENDIPPRPGYDLFTLRLEKLIEAGAYDRGFDIYARLENPPYHIKLAQAGVLAMIYSGQKSSACLEANSISLPQNPPEFWTLLRAYCDVTLSKTPGDSAVETLESAQGLILHSLALQPDYKFTYSPERYGTLRPLEQALLAAEEKLDISELEKWPEAPPPNHLQPLLNLSQLPADLEFRLLGEAVRWGLKSPQDLAELYIGLAKDHAGQDDEAGPPAENWLKIAFHYAQALAANDDSEAWAHIQKAHAALDDSPYAAAALSPFFDIIKTIKIASPDADDIILAAQITHMQGMPLPQTWIDSVENFYTQNKIDQNTLEALTPILVAAYLSKPSYQRKEDEVTKIWEEIHKISYDSQQFLKIFIENLDKGAKESDNTTKAYEKSLGLTLSRGYVMPSVSAWNALVEASQKDLAGETALLSINIIRNRALQNLYPMLLKDISKSLESVRLKHISEDMAISASLGYKQTKEK